MVNFVNKHCGIIVLILVLIEFCAGIIGMSKIRSDNNKQYHIGEQTCEKCHSHNTEGYHTFWNNDGTMAKNEKDADYTIMKCNDCGYTWHYELNNN